MHDYLSMVERFQKEIIDYPIPEKPQLLSPERTVARIDHLEEEVLELKDSLTVVDQADSFIDIIYIALGGLIEMGITPGPFFEEVHRANMDKVRGDNDKRPNHGGYDAIKPFEWKGPDFKPYLHLTKGHIEKFYDFNYLNLERVKKHFEQYVEKYSVDAAELVLSYFNVKTVYDLKSGDYQEFVAMLSHRPIDRFDRVIEKSVTQKVGDISETKTTIEKIKDSPHPLEGFETIEEEREFFENMPKEEISFSAVKEAVRKVGKLYDKNTVIKLLSHWGIDLKDFKPDLSAANKTFIYTDSLLLIAADKAGEKEKYLKELESKTGQFSLGDRRSQVSLENRKELLSINTPVLDEEDAKLFAAISPILKRITQLRMKKGQDYNTGVKLEDYFPFGHTSYFQMVHVKTKRLQSLLEVIAQGKEPNFDSIEDTILDLLNYATFYAEWLEAEKENK